MRLPDRTVRLANPAEYPRFHDSPLTRGHRNRTRKSKAGLGNASSSALGPPARTGTQGRASTLSPIRTHRLQFSQKELIMGRLTVTIAVGDQQGSRFENIEVTMDTGSTFTAVPRSILQELGIPVARTANSRLADGTTVPVDIGWAMITIEDITFPTQVIFAQEGQPNLLGVVTLEQALLAVDPVNQKLIPVDADRLLNPTAEA